MHLAQTTQALQRVHYPPCLHSRRWPVDRPALAALVDMGMSDRLIADYFNVSADRVATLKAHYNL